MKARDWLAERGLAIKGARGKFSTAAHAALVKAVAEGVKFSDYPKTGTAPVSRPESSTTGNPVVKSDPRESAYILPSDFRFPEGEYRAVDKTGKTHGMREVCSNCHNSLVNHYCNEPVIYSNIAVNILPIREVRH